MKKCEFCENEASFREVVYVNGENRRVDLCQECALNFFEPDPMDLAKQEREVREGI